MPSQVIFFVLLVSLPLYQAQDIIGTTCDKTLFVDVCKTALTTSNAKDLKGLAEAAVKVVSAHAAAVQKVIDSNTDPAIKQLVATCSEIYKTASSHLVEAEKALATNPNYETATIQISAAIRNQRSCEDGFKKAQKKSPFIDLNTKFSQLGNVALTIMSVAQKTTV